MSTPPAPGAPAGSRRFWVTVLCFALANATAWGVFYRIALSHRPALLSVDRFDPIDGTTVAARPVFTWHFNLDVAPQLPGSPPPGTITPAIAGQWKFTDPRTLCFTPDADLPGATRFTLTLPAARLRTAHGFQLDKNYTLSVQTPSIEMVDARQAAFGLDNCMLIELEFSDRVLPAEVSKYLSIRGMDSKEIHFLMHGDAAGKTVRVITGPVPLPDQDRDKLHVTIELKPGLTGLSGPLAMTDPVERELPISAELMATGIVAHTPAQGDAGITLGFNNPVDADSLHDVISIEPAMAYRLTTDGNEAVLTGAFAPGTRYAVKIAGTEPAQHAKSWAEGRHYPRPDTFSVLIPDRDARVWFEQSEGYLGSRGHRTLLAHAVNHSDLKLTVTRVYDNNLVAWRNAPGRSWRGNSTEPFSQPIAVRKLRLPKEKNKVQDLRLVFDDLLPAGADRDGVYRVALSADDSTNNASESDAGSDADELESMGYSMDRYADASTTVTLSDLGLTAKQTPNGVVAWVVSLSTGKPIEHAHLRLFSDKNQLLGETHTNAEGLAHLDNVHPAPGEQPAVLLSDLGTSPNDAASQPGLTWLDLHTSQITLADADTAGQAYLTKGFEAFIYTDRGVYRPGETVHFRAIVRGRDNAKPPVFPVKWQLRRPDLRHWKSEVVQLDRDGAAGLDIALPTDLSSGEWTAELGLPGEKESLSQVFGSVRFQVEDFVPNRMKVTLKVASQTAEPGEDDRLSNLDAPLTASMQADYLFGRPVSERPAKLVVRAQPATFEPKQWADWTFGDAADVAETLAGKHAIGGRAELPDATLDGRGHTTWDLDTKSLFIGYAGPWRVSLFSSVIETGGRAVSASRTVDVDCVPYYVGLHFPNPAASPGNPYAAEIALVAPSGQTSAGDATLEATLFRETWNTSLVFSRGSYHFESTRRLEPIADLTSRKFAAKAGHGAFQITPPGSGSYVLRVSDPKTGIFTTRAFFATEGAWEDNISRENPEKLELVVLPPPRLDLAAAWEAARRRDGTALLAMARTALANPSAEASSKGGARFRIGDDAQVIVRSPFAGQLLLTVETDSVISTQVIAMPASHMTVPVHITGACRPNAFVAATVIRAIDPDAKWAVHRAFGVARLNVDNTDRRLKVEIAAPTEVRPSNSLGIDVRLTDTTGRPAADTPVTVAAVDEGICQLTNFATPDPFAFFNSPRALGVHLSDFYSQLMPEVARPEKRSAVGGDALAADDDRHSSPVSARRVRPVSLFAGVLRTNADGIAHADFNVPEFSGQLRVMVVGYGDKEFGSSAKGVLVRSPVLVQSSWPRFAAPGDQFNVPLVVFNNAKTAGTVQVTIDLLDDAAACPISFRGAAGQSLALAPMTIKAGGQATVAFDVIAAQRAGVAHARLLATTNGESFEEHIELPVRPASPMISTGGYALATPDAPCKLTIPSGMLEGTDQLQVQISQRPTLELPRGLDYLERYPYGCSEQTTSTCFPLVYLGDIGKEIAPGVFDPQRVTDKVNSGILRLIGMQTADGGISMWPGERDAWPWGTVYAAHFLVEARKAGYHVPQEFYESVLAYVRNQLNYSGDEPDVIEGHCYVCYVLALAGRPERAVMSRLAELLTSPPPTYRPSDWAPYSAEARFDLAAAWLATGRGDLAASLIPHTLPLPRSTRAKTGNVGSPIRDRAVLINTLLAVEPDHPELPGLVQQLADAGRAGSWRSTQDTAFAVMALGHYLRQTQAEKPFDSAELRWDGRVIASTTGGKPLAWNATTQPSPDLTVRVDGTAGCKAHIAWLHSGVPMQPPPDSDSGMKVSRRYLDSHGQPLVSASVRSGDLVQVELTISAPGELENVVIDDLLPAGLEIENPSLQTSADGDAVEKEHKPGEVYFETTRREMRDDRLVLMGELSQGGSATYTYLARAITSGTFVVPPVRAECMYDIGTSSISGGGKTLTVLPIERSTFAHTDTN